MRNFLWKYIVKIGHKHYLPVCHLWYICYRSVNLSPVLSSPDTPHRLVQHSNPHPKTNVRQETLSTGSWRWGDRGRQCFRWRGFHIVITLTSVKIFFYCFFSVERVDQNILKDSSKNFQGKFCFNIQGTFCVDHIKYYQINI